MECNGAASPIGCDILIICSGDGDDFTGYEELKMDNNTLGWLLSVPVFALAVIYYLML